MKMQTVMRFNKGKSKAGDVFDYSIFKHGTIGEIVPYTNKITGKDDPLFRCKNGMTIFVASLVRAGADLVPVGDGEQ